MRNHVRETELRLSREALAGPMGERERRELADRVRHLECIDRETARIRRRVAAQKFAGRRES